MLSKTKHMLLTDGIYLQRLVMVFLLLLLLKLRKGLIDDRVVQRQSR